MEPINSDSTVKAGSESAPATIVPPITDPVAAVVPAPVTEFIQYDDFAKVKLRVATIIKAEAIEKSKKLLRLQVDLGDEQRQILAGIKEHYQPESLVGMQIVIVANLAPREVIKGEISNGMLLAASDASGKVIIISPSAAIAVGAAVR